MQLSLVLWLLSVLVSLSMATNPESTHTASIVEIQQTLALFPILIDSHRYDELDQVFKKDAFANFGTAGTSNLTGFPAITSFLHSLQNITSQHSYGTQFVNLTGAETASVTTYFTGLFYGRGDLQGQIFQNFGTYETDMKLTGLGWRIKKLTQISSGQMGNSSIVFPG